VTHRRATPKAVKGGVLQIICSAAARKLKLRHDARTENNSEEYLPGGDISIVFY